VHEVVVDGVVVVEVMVVLTMAPIEEETPTTETEPPPPMLSFPLTGNVASNWAICAKVSCCVYFFCQKRRESI
jgi:hypothetical protein